MPASLETRIRRFVRGVRLRSALAGATEGLAAAALALLAAVLVGRTLGLSLAPAPWIALPLALGLLLGAARRLVGGPFPRGAGAAWLDRRLGMEGLLLTARECDASAWEARLSAGLARARQATARLLPARLVRHVALAAAAIALLLVLPVPAPATARGDALAADALQSVEEELEALEENAGVDEERTDELRERIAAMKEGLERDGYVPWSDLDQVERAIEIERERRAGDLAKAMSSLTEFAQGGVGEGPGEGEGAGAADAPDRMAGLLDAARDAGLLESLPPGLLQKLGASGRDGGLDADGLPADPEMQRQLAAALAATAAEKLAELGRVTSLEGLDLDAMNRRLSEAVGEMKKGTLCKLCEDGDPSCPG